MIAATIEKIILILLVLLVILATAFIMIFLVGLVYEIFRGPIVGVVVDKSYVAPHSSMWLMPVGDVLIPQTIRHSAKWQVHVSDEQNVYIVPVDKDTYDSIAIGDKFKEAR